MKAKKRNIKLENDIIYSGFLVRSLAALIDCAVIGILCWPLFTLIERLLFGNIFPADIMNTITIEYQTQLNQINQTSLGLTDFIKKTYDFVISTQIFQNYFYDEHGLVKVLINNLIQVTFFAIIILIFWNKKQASLGMMILGIKIVDAKTFNKPSYSQLVIRMFSYLVAFIPLFLGIAWISFDPRKQGWHDKIASTIVIKNTKESK